MKADDSIKSLQDEAREFSLERDWTQFHNPKDLALSLTLEAAEVLEHFQWKDEQEVKNYLKSHKSDVGEELSDVLYWTLYMADRLNIDIVSAYRDKMAKNAAKYPVEKSRGNHKKYTEHAE